MTPVRTSCALPFLLALLALLRAGPIVADENGCIACHKSEDFYARQPKLYSYYQNWVQSEHSQAGVTCDDCHGGVATATNAAEAHAGVFPVSDPRSRLHFTRQPETCGSCHRGKQKQFEQSKHFGALMAETEPAPTCTTCHPAMNKRPSYKNIVLNACTSCHAPGNRQKLPPVVDEAETLLRHVNMTKGMLGWTSLHYEALQWPGDSRPRVLALEQRYEKIVSRIHRFDLEASEEATMSLLEDLRAIFDAEKTAKGAARAKDP
ncbi:MAG: multiheme c-type cytochrome [Halioglobus sp.]|jgi:hypothetical protein